MESKKQFSTCVQLRLTHSADAYKSSLIGRDYTRLTMTLWWL